MLLTVGNIILKFCTVMETFKLFCFINKDAVVNIRENKFNFFSLLRTAALILICNIL